MHVQVHGLDGVEDLVLAACLENQAYDRQCEGNRAAWLYSMFKNTPAYSHFSESILAAIAIPAEGYDLEQLCALAGLMGLDGDMKAACSLRDVVWSQPYSDEHLNGAHAIVMLDGVPAIIELARRQGRLVQETPNAWVYSLDDLTDDTELFDDALNELKRTAPSDPFVAAYLAKEVKRIEQRIDSETESDSAKKERLAANRERYRDETPVEAIIAAASANQRASARVFSRFGRWANTDDLIRILDHLKLDNDPESCMRLLWVFRSATLPRLDARVWELASDSTPDVRNAAVEALASLSDPRIGELGRERLRDPRFSAAQAEEIELFVMNYQTGDEALILAALERLTPDDHEAHVLAKSAQEVCSNNDDPALAGVAIWIYRTNPCSICREYAVEFLQRCGTLPMRIAEECLHDASEDTRALVKLPQ